MIDRDASAVWRPVRRRLLAALVLVLTGSPALAYERDVHFGLTWWLAMQAGFDRSQADAIAVANARVAGGMLETQALTPEYACLARSAEVAAQVQRRHFPAEVGVPAPPTRRAVGAGGSASRRDLQAVLAKALGMEHLMLGKFGEALHPLQDAWAHEGAPTVADRLGALACDPQLMPGLALANGVHSHARERTHGAVAATMAMAQATYEALLAYPPVLGVKRQAAPWPKLVAAVEAFARASTKTAKRAWFSERGLDDTGFLQGIGLPDGAQPGRLEWARHKFPELAADASPQHAIDVEARAFFDRLLVRWLGAEPVEDVVIDAAGGAGDGPNDAVKELITRMTLWKLADHASAAALAHAAAPLSAAQRRSVARLNRNAEAFVKPGRPAAAVYPLLAVGAQASPMLPYLVFDLGAAQGRPTLVALLRLRHAPNDTLLWTAEKRDGRWNLVGVAAVVEP